MLQHSRKWSTQLTTLYRLSRRFIQSQPRFTLTLTRSQRNRTLSQTSSSWQSLPPKTGRLQNKFIIRQLRVYKYTRINSHRFNYICLARSFLKLFCILSFHHLCLLFLLSEVRFVIFLINEYWILDIGIHAHVQMPIATAYSTVARIQASTVASSERYIRASTMQSNSLIPQENMSTILNALESHNTPKFRR